MSLPWRSLDKDSPGLSGAPSERNHRAHKLAQNRRKMRGWEIHKCSPPGSGPESRHGHWWADCSRFSLVDKWEDENNRGRKKLVLEMFFVF